MKKLIKHPGSIIFVVLAATIPFAAFLPRIVGSNEVKKVFPGRDRRRDEYESPV